MSKRNLYNLYVDVIFAYDLANCTTGRITPVDGEVHNPADSILSGFVAAHKDNRFNYKNVWDNHAGDTLRMRYMGHCGLATGFLIYKTEHFPMEVISVYGVIMEQMRSDGRFGEMQTERVLFFPR